MFCGKCGFECKDGEAFCGRCGNPLRSAQQDFTPANRIADQAPADPLRYEAEPQSGFADQFSQQSFGAAAPEPPKKKKLGKLPLIGIIAGAVIILALVLFFVIRGIRNTPENQYQKVEKSAISSTVSTLMDSYDRLSPSSGATGSEGDVTLTVSSELQRLLARELGIDMSWLDNVSIHTSTVTDGEQMAISGELSLNETSIISLDAALDAAGEMLYFKIPEFSNSYARMNLTQQAGIGNAGAYGSILSNLPDRELTERMLSRYLNLVVENIETVERDKATLKAGGVSKDYTTLTVTLDEDDLENIVLAILNELLEDEDLRTLCGSLYDSGIIAASSHYSDADDLYDELIDVIQHERDDIEDYGLGVENLDIEMTVYVDGKNNVRGRIIEVKSDDTNLEFSYKNPEDGKEYGLEISLDYYDSWDSVNVEISGKGEGSEGEFTVSYSGIDLAEIEASDFDRDALKDGHLNGTFTITPNAFLISQLGLSIDSAQLVAEIHSAEDSASISLALDVDGINYGTLAMQSATTSGGSVSIPADAQELEVWARGVNVDAVRSSLSSKLQGAGVPSTLISLILNSIL